MLRAHAFHGIRWLSCTIAPMVPGLPATDLLSIFRDVTDDRLNQAVERLRGYDRAPLIGRPRNAFTRPEEMDGITLMIGALRPTRRGTGEIAAISA